MSTVQTSVLSRAFVLPKKVLEFCDFSANVNFYLLVTNAGASIKVSHGIHTAWQHTSERPDGDDDWLKGRKYFTFDLSIWQLGIKLLMLETDKRRQQWQCHQKTALINLHSVAEWLSGATAADVLPPDTFAADTADSDPSLQLHSALLATVWVGG